MNTRLKITLAAMSLLLFTVVTGQGKDIYVSWDGTNNYPYTNWPDAATNIEWAVNAAASGDTVWISNGVYVLTNRIVTSSKTISIIGTNGMPVIDGNNVTQCFYHQSGSEVITLRNLFITRGTNSAGNYGGGAYLVGGSLVSDCIFSNNNAPYGGGVYHWWGAITSVFERCTFVANNAGSQGGGIYVDSPNQLAVKNCTFYTNTAASYGGGIRCGNIAILTGCTFIANVAIPKGGGLFISPSTTNFITHCTFASNVAQFAGGADAEGGGAFVISGDANSWIVVSNCYASNNTAYHKGGGLFIQGGGEIRNCTLARNSTTITSGDYGGAGIATYPLYRSPLIQDCIIEENTSSRWGGGVLLYGFTYNETMRNCLIRNNVTIGVHGGGIAVMNGSPLISSCTIVSNYAAGSGGGISVYGDGAHVENCIIYLNLASNPSYSNYFNSAAAASYTNCCLAPELSGGPAGYSTNNITSDPQFVDAAGNNYRLTRDSPCVNAGVNREWMSNAYDLDGHSRLDKFSGVADIGSYEYVFSGAMFRMY